MRRRIFPLVLSVLPAFGCGSQSAATDGDAGARGTGGGSGLGAPSGSDGSGATTSSGSSTAGGTGSTSGGSTSGGSSDGGASGPSARGDGGGAGDDGGACAIGASNVRVTEVDVGGTVAYSEVDARGASVGLEPLAISPIPSGGSRVAWMGNDGMVHVTQLDANDQVTGTPLGLSAYDVQDLYADDAGGVVLVSRPAQGGSAADHDCGNIDNLCGLASSYPTADPCMDMYLVRFDGAKETWAAKLTD